MLSIARSQSPAWRVYCSIVIILSTLQVYGDEADIKVTVLNPMGFIGPGTKEEIIVEIVNPIGSGVTILAASGHGYRPPRQRTNQAIRSPNLALRQQSRISYAGRPDRCEQTDPSCLTEGQYPIAPGESVRQVYIQAQVPADEPLGRELLWSNARIAIKTDSRPEPFSYYLHTDIIRVVNVNGDGDYSYFDEVELQHENGGIMQANLSASFSYPQQVLAGESITIEVTLTNTGSETLTITRGASPMFQDVEENLMLGYMYQFIGCQRECRRSGGNSPYLAPGETLMLEMGTFVYQNEYLLNGELTLDRVSLRVMDHLQRHEQVFPDHPPLRITIRSPSGAEIINPAMQVPDRLPLEVRDFRDVENMNLVYDPNTNMEWQQLTIADQFSMEEVEAAMGRGGPLEGFRFAYTDEVELLILNHVHSAGIQLQLETLYSFLDSEPNELIAQLIELMGQIPSVNSGPRTIGIVADSLPPLGSRSALYGAIELTARERGAMLVTGEGIGKRQISIDSSLYDYVGYWLVREL